MAGLQPGQISETGEERLGAHICVYMRVRTSELQRRHSRTQDGAIELAGERIARRDPVGALLLLLHLVHLLHLRRQEGVHSAATSRTGRRLLAIP